MYKICYNTLTLPAAKVSHSASHWLNTQSWPRNPDKMTGNCKSQLRYKIIVSRQPWIWNFCILFSFDFLVPIYFKSLKTNTENSKTWQVTQVGPLSLVVNVSCGWVPISPLETIQLPNSAHFQEFFFLIFSLIFSLSLLLICFKNLDCYHSPHTSYLWLCEIICIHVFQPHNHFY